MVINRNIKSLLIFGLSTIKEALEILDNNHHGYVIVIEESGVVEGKFPKRALKMVLEWYELHKNELLEDWELCAKRQQPKPISPLE